MSRTVRCFACGEEIRVADENAEAELHCPACGKRVSLLSLDEATPASERTDQIRATPPKGSRHEDHFRALQPLQSITLTLGKPAYGIEVAEQELRAFVGRRARSYVGDWMSVLEGRKKRPAFNAMAFLFAGLWLPYRKLYGATAVLLGVLLVVNAMELFVDMTTSLSPPQQTVIEWLGWGVAIVGWFICGCFANRWYLSRAISVINDVRSRHLDEEQHLKQIAERGGTSLGSSIVIFVGFITLNFIGFHEAITTFSPIAADWGHEIIFNGGTLSHTWSVSEPEARKLGEYLVKIGIFDGRPETFHITRSNGTIQIRRIVRSAWDRNPQFVQSQTHFSQQLSRDVFGGETVELHVCNGYGRTFFAVKSK
jgi:hypothetical protein